MKKSIFLVLILTISLQLLATDWTPPSYVTPPSLPDDATLRVVGANVQNYLSDFTASNTSCTTQSTFDSKTSKMAKVFDYLQADILVLCEVQQDDNILSYLVDAMNTEHKSNVYAYVTDGTSYSKSSSGYGYIKCGYVYNKNKVTPTTSRPSFLTSQITYKYRMQVLCFKENATGEKLVVSINHFKAKTISDDYLQDRIDNANTVISGLRSNYGDPDILLMGDLNSAMGEQPIINLQNAGYEDQMYKYDNNAYTYNYKGSYQMIDHAMANNSMAKQIVGAYPFHICTSGSNAKYSDHDCYVVGLNLGGTTSIEDVMETPAETKAKLIYIDGKLFIRVDDQLYDMMGRRVE